MAKTTDGVKRVGRKLLIASLGVGTVSYGACGGSTVSPSDGAVDQAPAEVAAEHPDAANDNGSPSDAGAASDASDAADAAMERQLTGNLVAP